MSSLRDGSTDLYRFFDADDRLLYVGISFSAITRAAQHRTTANWWPDMVMMTVERFDTRQDALEAEREAIRTERPAYNIVHSDGTTPTPPAWRCVKCRRSVGVKKHDGYIQASRGGDWSCVCAKCDSGDDFYWIEPQRIATSEELKWWTWHLADKSWFDPCSWELMVRRCHSMKNGGTFVYLEFDAWRDMRNRRTLTRSAAGNNA